MSRPIYFVVEESVLEREQFEEFSQVKLHQYFHSLPNHDSI